uniref:Uncharacterized protein n=1 Tax=Glossina pallidipes TaxID=7398 RepID=A0A1A9ZSK9_GLOPL
MVPRSSGLNSSDAAKSNNNAMHRTYSTLYDYNSLTSSSSSSSSSREFVKEYDHRIKNKWSTDVKYLPNSTMPPQLECAKYHLLTPLPTKVLFLCPFSLAMIKYLDYCENRTHIKSRICGLRRSLHISKHFVVATMES